MIFKNFPMYQLTVSPAINAATPANVCAVLSNGLGFMSYIISHLLLKIKSEAKGGEYLK